MTTELPLHLLSGSKQWHHTRFALPETQIRSEGTSTSKEMKEAWLRHANWMQISSDLSNANVNSRIIDVHVRYMSSPVRLSSVVCNVREP